MQQIMLKPKRKESIVERIARKANALVETISDLIEPDPTPMPVIKDNVTPTITNLSTITKPVSVVKENATPTTDILDYPEFRCLSYSERHILSPSIELVGNLRSLVTTTSFVNSETVYNQLYLAIPNAMVTEMTSSMNYYWKLRNRVFGGDASYEMIMNTFMNCAADINNVPLSIVDNMISFGKGYDVVAKVINHIKKREYQTLDLDLFPIRPALLALLWALLLMELTAKYTNSCASFERERIAKLAMSLVLSLFAGFTGYIHTGGVTSILRTFYDVRKSIEREHPSIAPYIPQFLKFSDCPDFDNLTRNKQISAMKGLNMAYTFRVGDSLLKNLSGNTVCTDTVIKETLKSVWPLPMADESKKMYRLYTGAKIYYL